MSLDQKWHNDIISSCIFLFSVFCCIWVKSTKTLLINGNMLCNYLFIKK